MGDIDDNWDMQVNCSLEQGYKLGFDKRGAFRLVSQENYNKKLDIYNCKGQFAKNNSVW